MTLHVDFIASCIYFSNFQVNQHVRPDERTIRGRPEAQCSVKGTDKVPLEKGSPEEFLRKLGDNFGLDDGVVEALLRLGIESLQEVRFLWASEQAIETWIGKLGLGDKALLMTARVRTAWAAVGLYYRQVEQDRSKIALSDLDTMLGETEPRDTKQQFWRRYKMRFPPEIHPADTTISRVAREIQKRMLCVYNIWRVKALQFQLAPG